MKKLAPFTLVLAIFTLALFACQSSVQEKAAEISEEKLAKVEMKVDGMVCAMGCAKFIQDKVADHDGVRESKVDFENGTAFFTINENAISAEELEKFIDEIHDGQYDASITKVNQGEASKEDLKETDELDDDADEEEDKSVVQVVNKIQNISFPELLTYFMRRL